MVISTPGRCHRGVRAARGTYITPEGIKTGGRAYRPPAGDNGEGHTINIRRRAYKPQVERRAGRQWGHTSQGEGHTHRQRDV